MLDSQNLHSDSAKLEDDSSVKTLPILLKEQKHIRHELSLKRKELWETIKPLLSEQNLADLDKMRRGEYIPGSPMTSQETSK